MDWNLAIERHREALKHVLAMLVAMAGLAVGPHAEVRADPELVEGEPRRTLPRHLHRAILRLLRPAESAVRRLIIVAARGLVVTLPPARPRKAKPAPTFLSKPGGTGIYLPPGVRVSGVKAAIAGTPSLPLFDPLPPWRRRARPVALGVPRISVPGFSEPFSIPPPPSPDDPVNAARLALRLAALAAAMDDLPAQARRFARWRGRRADAAGAQNGGGAEASGAQHRNRDAGRVRRVWPLRPGRPPGQRPARHRTEVHEILHDLHGLAFDVLESPDTS